MERNRMHRRALFLVTMAALLVEMTSCGSSTSRPISVTVSSSASSVPVNASVFFSANVANTSNQTVTWAVVGGAANGTIDSSGRYTAPAQIPNPAQVMVTATSQVDAAAVGQSSVTVTLNVTISPPSAILQTLTTTTFSATVQGASNAAVTWQVNGIVGGDLSVGTITQGGFYQAPESVPENVSIGQTTTVSVQAVPQASPSSAVSATVTVTSPNQLGQNLPIKFGTSGGNVNDRNATECASGTLGSLVTRGGTQFLLSNNHVLADSDAGSIGDAISQPGLIDAPSPCFSSGTSTVGNLSQFVNLEKPNPPADAAIAQVASGAVNANGTIIELGDSAPSGIPSDEAPASTILPVASLVPNTTAVAKSGRSTGLTCSTVEATNADISVQYQHGLGGPNFTVVFSNQIAINGGSFSAAGDSGSLIVSQGGAQPVALLYAGNSSNTVGVPAATVLASFPDNSNPPNFPTFVGPSTRNAVVGCTSSGADAFSATGQTGNAQLSATEVSKAEAAKNQNAALLMTNHPAILAVGAERSLDRPERAAVVLFIQRGQPLVRPLPHSVAGVPTRVIAVESLPTSGVLDRQSTAKFLKNAGPSAQPSPTPDQLTSAKAVKDRYADALMKQTGVLGVGVTSSLDNPSEAAIMVYVETGKLRNPIPLELDGIRVRVKSTDKFRAYGWGPAHPHRTQFPRALSASRSAE